MLGSRLWTFSVTWRRRSCHRWIRLPIYPTLKPNLKRIRCSVAEVMSVWRRGTVDVVYSYAKREHTKIELTIMSR